MRVSVVLTSYNYGQYLKDTIKSVVNQTFTDWEMVIIDDCSIDNSMDIIMEFANSDSRIKVIKNFENQGLKQSIQTALLAVSGDWVAFLESDDMWRTDYLENKVRTIEKYPQSGLIYNDVEFFGENAENPKKKFSKIVRINKSLKFPKNMFYNFGCSNLILTMSSVMVKKTLLDNLDFSTPIEKLLDWYLYIQLARETDFYYIDQPLTRWRQHPSSYIGHRDGIKFKFANISAYLYIYKKEPYNLKLLIFILTSTFLMCLKRLHVYLIE